MHPRFYALLLAGALAPAAAHAAAASCEAQSGKATTALLELYTSEGCNSCPPADRWLAQLPDNGYCKDRVVPLGLHVDYWNYLGWVDPYAQSAFSARQREFARRSRARTVYTPQLVLSGREYRGWWRNDLERALREINRTPPAAAIRLGLERAGATLHVRATASVAEAAPASELYVALYESDLRNEIAAGENAGKVLQHAFVVRRLLGPHRVPPRGETRFEERLTLPADWNPAHLGVAAFVQETGGTRVVQALALDMCP